MFPKDRGTSRRLENVPEILEIFPRLEELSESLGNMKEVCRISIGKPFASLRNFLEVKVTCKFRGFPESESWFRGAPGSSRKFPAVHGTSFSFSYFLEVWIPPGSLNFYETSRKFKELPRS